MEVPTLSSHLIELVHPMRFKTIARQNQFTLPPVVFPDHRRSTGDAAFNVIFATSARGPQMLCVAVPRWKQASSPTRRS